MVQGDPTKPLTGRCACAAVRYRLDRPPMITHACHCRYCQRVSGSAFGLNAMIESEAIKVLGMIEPEIVATPSTMEGGQKLHRCPACKLALWSNHPLLGTKIAFVFTGTLDEPWRLTPDIHCFTETRHPWVILPEGVPASAGNYDERELWSPETVARIEAAMGEG